MPVQKKSGNLLNAPRKIKNQHFYKYLIRVFLFLFYFFSFCKLSDHSLTQSEIKIANKTQGIWFKVLEIFVILRINCFLFLSYNDLIQSKKKYLISTNKIPLLFYFYLSKLGSGLCYWVQTLNNAVCISHTAHNFRKDMNPTNLPPAMSK